VFAVAGLLASPVLGVAHTPWTQEHSARATVAAVGPMTYRVFLAPRGGSRALRAAVLAVSTPGNRRYRHFLTTAQFRARYEPTRASTLKVEHELRALGLQIVPVESRRRWILARGVLTTPSALRDRVLGVATVPAAAGAFVSRGPQPPVEARSIVGFQPPRPCSRYYGQRSARYEADGRTPLPAFRGGTPPYNVCGYIPRQLRGAYEGRTRLKGRGVTVAVVDPFASGTIRRDADRYSVSHGEPAFARHQFSERLPKKFTIGSSGTCSTPPTAWSLEETLDVEAVHAMAPAAKIRYYAAPHCDDPPDPGPVIAFEAIVDENRASIVTDSYGSVESTFSSGDRAGYEQAFLQAAMQGITVLYSTGDFGSILGYPASDPSVTAVGGVSAAIDRRDRLQFEAAWETDRYVLSPGGAWTLGRAESGGTGGFSKVFNRPRWQRGVVPASSPAGRALPDLSLDGNAATGMATGETQRFPAGTRFGQLLAGGTSLATPLTAGMEALAVQAAHGRLGWINPAIYPEARRRARTFTDVRPTYDDRAVVLPVYNDPFDPTKGEIYMLRTLGDSVGFGTPLMAAPGWDPATGIGTPNSRYLVSQGR
jgi:subtilase family serine protease